jgi:serine/threonine protein kinase
MYQNLAPGATLRDRYEILGLVGQGGMGAVYKAADRRLPGRVCAVKEIWPPPGTTMEALAQAREQFLREASTLARLDHPNLPKVSDFFSEPSGGESDPESVRDYLVMDYVPGRDLQQIVNEARREGRFLDEAEVLGWMAPLCDALTYLHGQDPSVVHRDVKPANIKLTPDGRIKLVDFGLVKPLDPEDPRTLTGVRGIGSLPYTPLEQYAGELGHTDVRSDLYGLGATLYHLLTGCAPASAQERFLQAEVLPPVRQVNPHVSREVERAVEAAMALHPNDRPATVAAWCRMLLGEAMAVPVVHLQATGWGEALRANVWLLLIALASVIAAIVVTFR